VVYRFCKQRAGVAHQTIEFQSPNRSGLDATAKSTPTVY
jgi:hypothetical protein